MLHFSLLNSPRSAKNAKNAKAPGAGQTCFEGNQTEMPKRTALFF